MSIRKVLIPVVAGLMISPALMAADLAGNSTARTVSNEFLGTAAAADIVAGDVLAVALGAEYAIGDIITLAFSGGALDGATVPTSVTVAAGALNGITLGLLSATADEAIYRVTDVDATGVTNTTVGVLADFAAADDLEFGAREIDAAGGVTVSFSAATDTGIPLDTGGGDLRSLEFIAAEDEYDVTVTIAFDQTVDVEQDREAFVAGDDDEGETTLVDLVFAAGQTAFVDQDIVWTGDFGWIIDDDDATAGIQPIAGVVTIAGCASIVVTATTISATCPAGAVSLILDPSVNLDALGDLVILPATAYSVTVTVNFTGFGGATGTVSFTLAGGEWVLNGFQALIPYMPYGTTISQVIYLANRGTQSGDVTVDWIDQNGNTGSLGVVAVLGATRTLSLGNIIRDALPATQRGSGRLALTVTANVPAADVQINSQYNVSGNRAFTLHEDNRP